MKEVLPSNDTFEIDNETFGSPKQIYNDIRNDAISYTDEKNENSINTQTKVENPLYIANKYIGVYEGKFGILTK